MGGGGFCYSNLHCVGALYRKVGIGPASGEIFGHS